MISAWPLRIAEFDALGKRHGALADLGGLIAGLAPHEEFRAQAQLQPVDAADDGGVIHAHALGRRRHRALAGDGQAILQIVPVEVHVSR